MRGEMDWDVMLIEHGRTTRLDPRHDVMNHSPDGFSWGYQGSGPSQTALAILCDAIGPERAVPLHHEFKRVAIATLAQNQGWSMTLGEVLRVTALLEEPAPAEEKPA
jgi:hypothetical protein